MRPGPSSQPTSLEREVGWPVEPGITPRDRAHGSDVAIGARGIDGDEPAEETGAEQLAIGIDGEALGLGQRPAARGAVPSRSQADATLPRAWRTPAA